MDKKVVVIRVSGGLVTDVYANKDVEVHIYDFDVFGTEEVDIYDKTEADYNAEIKDLIYSNKLVNKI